MTTATALAPLPSFTAQLWDRLRVETKEFVRSKDQMIFIFSFPIVFLVLFGTIFGNQELAFGVTFPQYFLAGMIASGILNTGFQSLAIGLALDREENALKRLRGTPLSPTAYFAGKVVHVLTVSAIQITLLLVIAKLAFGITIPNTGAAWATFGWVFVLGTAASTVLGIAMSSVPRNAKSASAVVTLPVLILQFISGVYFVFSQLPGWLQHVAEVFPLKWLAQGMRSVFLPDEYSNAEVRGSWEHSTTAWVLAAWLVVGLLLALKTFRWQRRDDT